MPGCDVFPTCVSCCFFLRLCCSVAPRLFHPVAWGVRQHPRARTSFRLTKPGVRFTSLSTDLGCLSPRGSAWVSQTRRFLGGVMLGLALACRDTASHVPSRWALTLGFLSLQTASCSSLPFSGNASIRIISAFPILCSSVDMWVTELQR